MTRLISVRRFQTLFQSAVAVHAQKEALWFFYTRKKVKKQGHQRKALICRLINAICPNSRWFSLLLKQMHLLLYIINKGDHNFIVFTESNRNSQRCFALESTALDWVPLAWSMWLEEHHRTLTVTISEKQEICVTHPPSQTRKWLW